jgi:hypothetical protein
MQITQNDAGLPTVPVSTKFPVPWYCPVVTSMAYGRQGDVRATGRVSSRYKQAATPTVA